jgi:ParB family chromosome partitioning protein
LGRGLAALLGAPFEESVPPEKVPRETTNSTSSPAAAPAGANSPQIAVVPAKADIIYLNVYEIDDNPFQPRRDFSEPEIASLAESLKEHDMLQPILVRRIGERYQLISGERRLRAAIRAGWSTVPARIRQADDRLVAELAIVENLQRKDLNPVEKALSFKRYLDEHKCTQDDLAQRLKIDRSTIANLMRLLELPQQLLDSIRKGEVSAGHARALLPLGDETEQIAFAQRIRSEGLSVRDVERLVTERITTLDGEIVKFEGADTGKQSGRTKNDQVASLEQQLRLSLGTKVEVRTGARGRGRIVIHFPNHDEFERIYQQLSEQGPPRLSGEAA